MFNQKPEQEKIVLHPGVLITKCNKVCTLTRMARALAPFNRLGNMQP